MSQLWNLWEATPPPVCTVKKALHYKEITNLKNIVFEILNSLKKMFHLDKEAAVLSRILYKYKRMHRHEKGMKTLVQLHLCLKRYLKLNFYNTVNSFKQCIPSKLTPTATHAYLPTRQMLKWILLRLQAFSQLFKRIFELSKSTASYFYQRLSLGWNLNLCFVILSITARIWAWSKFILLKCIDWYSSLYRLLPYLESTVEFLSDYEFPTDLKKWLGDVDLSPPKMKTSIDKMFEMIDLVRDEDEADDGDDDVKIISEKFMKSLRSLGVTEVEPEIEEIVPEKEGIAEKAVQGRGVKRPQTAMEYEDLGVPIEDNDEDVVEVPVKKSKKKERLQKKKRTQE